MGQSSKSFAEFFAGIGLVRAGLAPGGWECVYANDFDPKKREMYEGHFGPSPEYDLGDVWDLERVVARMPCTVTLATASFPCTDLSLAGHWRGLDGQHSSAFFAFLRVLDRLRRKPPIVMLENVVGFLASHGGRDFERATGELAGLGYYLDAFVLDARHFVPQSRPRVFVLGVRSHLRNALPSASYERKLFTDDATPEADQSRPAVLTSLIARTKLDTGWLHTKLPSPPTLADTLDTVIEAGDGEDWWDAGAVAKHLEHMQAPSRARLEDLRNRRTVRVGTAFRRTRLGVTRLEVRFDIAGCLRTPKGGSARQIVVRVGRGRVDLRWMTGREYARLQGAGDFRIAVGEQQAMYGFGDAVCVPAISWIDRHVLTPLAEAHGAYAASAGTLTA